MEYALVMAALLAICVGLGALFNALGDGLLVEHALMSAAHHLQAVAPGSIADVFLY